MDNLARVIAVSVQTGQIQPCIRINKGVYTASTAQNAQFHVEITITYTSGGQHQGPVISTQLVSGTEFMQVLDAHTIRAKGQAIGIRSQPDAGTPIVVATRVLINDAAGTPVECWYADTASYYAPRISTSGGGSTAPAVPSAPHGHDHD